MSPTVRNSAMPKPRREDSVALEEYRSDQDKPGANRDTGVFAKTDGRTKTAEIAATSPPARTRLPLRTFCSSR